MVVWALPTHQAGLEMAPASSTPSATSTSSGSCNWEGKKALILFDLGQPKEARMIRSTWRYIPSIIPSACNAVPPRVCCCVLGLSLASAGEGRRAASQLFPLVFGGTCNR